MIKFFISTHNSGEVGEEIKTIVNEYISQNISKDKINTRLKSDSVLSSKDLFSSTDRNESIVVEDGTRFDGVSVSDIHKFIIESYSINKTLSTKQLPDVSEEDFKKEFELEDVSQYDKSLWDILYNHRYLSKLLLHQVSTDTRYDITKGLTASLLRTSAIDVLFERFNINTSSDDNLPPINLSTNIVKIPDNTSFFSNKILSIYHNESHLIEKAVVLTSNKSGWDNNTNTLYVNISNLSTTDTSAISDIKKEIEKNSKKIYGSVLYKIGFDLDIKTYSDKIDFFMMNMKDKLSYVVLNGVKLSEDVLKESIWRANSYGYKIDIYGPESTGIKYNKYAPVMLKPNNFSTDDGIKPEKFTQLNNEGSTSLIVSRSNKLNNYFEGDVINIIDDSDSSKTVTAEVMKKMSLDYSVVHFDKANADDINIGHYVVIREGTDTSNDKQAILLHDHGGTDIVYYDVLQKKVDTISLENRKPGELTIIPVTDNNKYVSFRINNNIIWVSRNEFINLDKISKSEITDIPTGNFKATKEEFFETEFKELPEEELNYNGRITNPYYIKLGKSNKTRTKRELSYEEGEVIKPYSAFSMIDFINNLNSTFFNGNLKIE